MDTSLQHQLALTKGFNMGQQPTTDGNSKVEAAETTDKELSGCSRGIYT